jgi:hypothetical protein
MAANKPLEVLRKTLRNKLKDAGEAATVPSGDLRTVLDELGRLQQSNDRLRRQNRRLRLRLQAAGVTDADVSDDASDAGGEDGDEGGS